MEWTDPTWLAGAHAWIDEHVTRNGPTEQVHLQRWSTVLRVPTERGDVYFKANEPALRYEAALVSLLAARRPDCVPPLLAADLERGWLLMEDAGTRLRGIVSQERDLSRWLDILPLYAGLQLDLAADVPALIAAGVPDLRLAGLAEKYEHLLDDVPALVLEDPRLRDAIPRVRDLCDDLAAFGLPETIEHDDFHDGQVYVRDGRYLILDWGDACVTHPFFTLAVTLGGVLSWGLDDVQGSVDVTPFRDAYLVAFAPLAEEADLQAAAAIALRLGWICRAVNAALGSSTPAETRARLQMFLES
jgi:hypothetical protein